MKQYLPMGSIVKIKDAKRKTIIVGEGQETNHRFGNTPIYDIKPYIPSSNVSNNA